MGNCVESNVSKVETVDSSKENKGESGKGGKNDEKSEVNKGGSLPVTAQSEGEDVPITFRLNPLGGLEMREATIGKELVFVNETRTVLLENAIEEGIYHWAIQIKYGGKGKTLHLGIVLPNVISNCDDKTVGELPGTCALSMSASSSVLRGVELTGGVPPNEDPVPNETLVEIEVDMKAYTVTFFVDEKRIKRAISSVGKTVHIGISGSFGACFAPMWYRRLNRPTGSTVYPAYYGYGSTKGNPKLDPTLLTLSPDFLPNPAGGVAMEQVIKGDQFFFPLQTRTIFRKELITEGIHYWDVKVHYDPANEGKIFHIGVAGASLLDMAYSKQLGRDTPGSYALKFSAEGCSLSGVSDVAGLSVIPVPVPDKAVVGVEVDTKTKQISFFVNSERIARGIMQVPTSYFLGISGSGHASFTNISFRQLTSPTKSSKPIEYFH